MQGGILNLGAHWIHGVGENPLWKFVQDEGLEIAEDSMEREEGGSGLGEGLFYLPGGEQVEELLLEETLHFLDEVRKLIYST